MNIGLNFLTGVILSILGAVILDNSVNDFGRVILIYLLLSAGISLIMYTFGYSIGAFEASQHLKDKYTLKEKS